MIFIRTFTKVGSIISVEVHHLMWVHGHQYLATYLVSSYVPVKRLLSFGSLQMFPHVAFTSLTRKSTFLLWNSSLATDTWKMSCRFINTVGVKGHLFSVFAWQLHGTMPHRTQLPACSSSFQLQCVTLLAESYLVQVCNSSFGQQSQVKPFTTD